MDLGLDNALLLFSIEDTRTPPWMEQPSANHPRKTADSRLVTRSSIPPCQT